MKLMLNRDEVVENIPFDDYDNNLSLKVIYQRLKNIYGLIRSNNEFTSQ